MEDNKEITARKELYFRLAELANASTDEAKKAMFLNMADKIVGNHKHYPLKIIKFHVLCLHIYKILNFAEFWKLRDSVAYSSLNGAIQRDIDKEMNQLSTEMKVIDTIAGNITFQSQMLF